MNSNQAILDIIFAIGGLGLFIAMIAIVTNWIEGSNDDGEF